MDTPEAGKSGTSASAAAVVKIALSVPELMALKNAARNDGFVERDSPQWLREKLRGLGLLEYQRDILDHTKFLAAVAENRRALTAPKPDPGSADAIHAYHDVLHHCARRLQDATRSGLCLTDLGRAYADTPIDIVLPGLPKPPKTSAAPAAGRGSNQKRNTSTKRSKL